MSIVESCLSLLFPATCLHCGELVSKDPLCTDCANLLIPFSAEEHCTICFDYTGVHKDCSQCYKKIPSYDRIASVFPYEGAAETLIKKYKYSGYAFLVDRLADYLVAQWSMLNWDYPDFIIPLPSSTLRTLRRGFNPTYLLAEEFAKRLEVPLSDNVYRSFYHFPQAALTRRQRRQQPEADFFLRDSKFLEDKKVLLVDDVYTTGTTVNNCVKTLLKSYPQQIDVLTFCKTI